MSHNTTTEFQLTANESVFTLLRDRIDLYAREQNLDPEEHINGPFLDNVSIITDYDKDFIYEMAERLERIKLGFALISLVPMEKRMEESDLILGREIRSGYRRISDKPYAIETVRNHEIETAKLAELFHAGSPHLAQIVYTCRWHDSLEGAPGDLTPTCPLDIKEKKHLEHLSTRIMCEGDAYGHPAIQRLLYALNLYDEKIQGTEGMRCHVKEMDELQMAEKVSDIARRAPTEDKAHAKSIEEGMFLPYIAERLRSDRAKYYFDYHMQYKDSASSLYDLRERAVNYAHSKAPKMAYPDIPTAHVSFGLLPSNYG